MLLSLPAVSSAVRSRGDVQRVEESEERNYSVKANHYDLSTVHPVRLYLILPTPMNMWLATSF